MITTTTTPMTPRALRVNLPRDEVRGLLSDIDAWQQATQARLTFSGVLHGPYALPSTRCSRKFGSCTARV